MSEPTPASLPDVPSADTEPGSKKPRKKVIFGLATALVIAAGASIALVKMTFGATPLEDAVVACTGSDVFDVVHGHPSGESLPDREQFDDVYDDTVSGIIELSDEGRLLTVQTLPVDQDTLGLSTLVLDCVLISVEAPQWVIDRVDETKSDGGPREINWDRYAAQVSHNRDHGTNFLLRLP